MKLSDINACVIIPTYNNQITLKNIIEGVLSFSSGSDVIVVNDGSTDNTSEILSVYKEKIILLSNSRNKGKGYSLRKGFEEGIKRGFKNAITIDSDGQHFPEDIPKLINASKENPGALLMGSRNMQQEGVPGKSSFGNKFSNFWFYVETGIKLPDTQTGFRLYPLEPLSKIKLVTNKFETEIEVIVKLAWKGVKIVPVDIKVLYEIENRVSHFRPFKDFIRISILNTYLVILALFYYIPKRALKKNIFEIIKKEAIKPEETNLMKSASIGFGVFMGIFPVWGFQLLIGIPLAILFKMNKVLFIAAAHISIPPMIPLIIYASYVTGGLLVSNDYTFTSIDNITRDSIHLYFFQYFIGAIILAICTGLAGFLFSYCSLLIIRPNGNRRVTKS